MEKTRKTLSIFDIDFPELMRIMGDLEDLPARLLKGRLDTANKLIPESVGSYCDLMRDIKKNTNVYSYYPPLLVSASIAEYFLFFRNQ